MDIFSVLVVIAVMTIAIVKQSNKHKGEVAGRPAKKQPTPPFFAEEEAEEKLQMPPVGKPRMRMQRPVLREEEKKRPEASPRLPETQSLHGEDVSLRTPADARRAFIYSEIFDRKYD